MTSAVSTEKPKGVAIREIARELFAQPREGRHARCSSAARRSSTPAAASTLVRS